jgi:hypothetical protein
LNHHKLKVIKTMETLVDFLIEIQCISFFLRKIGSQKPKYGDFIFELLIRILGNINNCVGHDWEFCKVIYTRSKKKINH